ncbi:MAG: aminotransferase class V-fold PLP-dependent enzyme [Candidatus Nanopelagicales bacterium]
MTVYLDMAATTPVSKRVADVVVQYMTEDFGNAGSRTHEWGTTAKRAVGRARAGLAEMFDVQPDELIFTSGATESNNIAILGLAEAGRRSGRMHIVSSATEHKAVLEPLAHLESNGFEVELLRPGQTGRFDAGDVLSRVRDDTLLVSLMHVNNETGVIQPISEIANTLIETPTLFHVDAAQSFAKVEPEVLRGPIDLISFSGHKIGAPKGIGGLVIQRRGWEKPPLQPLLFGGGQERALRPGTLPVPLIMGLFEAAKEQVEQPDQGNGSAELFKSTLIEAVQDLGGTINGDTAMSSPYILNFSIPGVDAEAMVIQLASKFGFSTGSACTSTNFTPSHVLGAMGTTESVTARAVRFSWMYGSSFDVPDLINRLRGTINS